MFPSPADRPFTVMTILSPSNFTLSAWADWWEGTRNARLWWVLAWYDIALKYRRSLLGPLWLTISMAILLIGMGPLYSNLFNVPMNRFFPHLTLGIILWNFFSTSINDGCGVFIAAAPYLKQSDFPGSTFVWRSLARNIIQLAHHAVLFLPVALWFGIAWSSKTLLFIPGFLIVIINLHALSISLGLVCARFRDVAQIVASGLQLMMFLTPVFWFPERVTDHMHLILYNPFAQLLDVMRLPLLGVAPAGKTWLLLACITCVNVAIAAVLYAQKRRQVVYWL
jgi:lipopolysaccharide transport system permease protein